MQPRSARALFALAFVLITAAVAGCSKSSSNSTAPPVVTGPNFSFAFPAAGSIATPGTSNKRTFTATEVGSWTYHCIPHGPSGMTGTVIVDAGSVVDSMQVRVGWNGTGQDFKYDPPTVTIKPGGYVRWFNVSSRTDHTVSRP